MWLNDVKARIADLATRKEAAPGKAERFRSRAVMSCLGNIIICRDNAKGFTEDGWLRTGDIGYFDRNG